MSTIGSRAPQVRWGEEAEKLRAMAQAGMTLAEIGEEFDASVSSVRAAARRYGVQVTREYELSIRQKAEAMRPVDAVDYLLGVLGRVAGSMMGGDHPVDGWGFHMTPQERRFLICLYDAKGEVRTHEALLDAIAFGYGADEPQIKLTAVIGCKVRKKLPASKAELVTAWGRGFRLIVKEAAA